MFVRKWDAFICPGGWREGGMTSHPDHGVPLVVGLSDASVFLNLGCPSLPQRMQIILRSTKEWSAVQIHSRQNL